MAYLFVIGDFVSDGDEARAEFVRVQSPIFGPIEMLEGLAVFFHLLRTDAFRIPHQDLQIGKFHMKMKANITTEYNAIATRYISVGFILLHGWNPEMPAYSPSLVARGFTNKNTAKQINKYEINLKKI